MNLATLLPPQAVIPQLSARDKKQALKLLAAHASTLVPLSEREIFTVLMERESAGCTGMGSGVCIPHGRYENLKNIQAIFARLEKPIDFGAADGRPVDLVFLLLSPEAANTDHIKALSLISRLLRDKKLCETLRRTRDAKMMYEILTAVREEDAA